MARRMRISAAAVTLMAISADASTFAWQQRRNAWQPPTETLAARDIMAELGWSLEPTPAPVPREAIPEIIKRQTHADNTCGFVSGIGELSLYCDVDSMCVYNTLESVVGCCPDTSTNCDLWTTCLDSADGASLLSLGRTVGSATMWCGRAQYPSCFTHVYGDSAIEGYNLYGCAATAGTDIVSYNSNPGASSHGGSSSGLDVNVATATVTASNSGGTGGSGSSSSSSSGGGGKKKSSNTGAIVGGVVGGVAALALLAIVGFFVSKKKKQAIEENKTASPPMANIPPAGAPVTTFPPQSPMPGQPPMAMNNVGASAAMYPHPGPGSPPFQQQGAHVPSMYSMGPASSSPGTDYISSGYPSGTSTTHPMMTPPLPPQSVSPQPQQMYAQPPYGQQSPPPPQQAYGAAWAAPPQQPPPPQQQHGFVAELSTEKGHGEVRELPG